jgi:hypothetical protein
MTEKTKFSEVDYASPKDDFASHKEKTIHDETPGRQASVALNVVHNPLQVRSSSIPLYFPFDKTETDHIESVPTRRPPCTMP